MYMTKLSFVGEDTIYVNNRKFISERVHFREMERLHKEILELKMQIEGIKEEDLLTSDDIDLDAIDRSVTGWFEEGGIE